MRDKQCSFCDNDNIVTYAGHAYCSDHLYLFEKVRIDDMLGVGGDRQNQFYMWAFNTIMPKFSDLSKLHDRVDRGEWDKRLKRFDKPQDIYLLEAYITFLKELAT